MTYILSIMHDAGIIIGHFHGVDDVGGVPLEVELHATVYVLEEDVHMAVSVWPCLLMVEADSMAQLMDDDTFLSGKHIILYILSEIHKTRNHDRLLHKNHTIFTFNSSTILTSQLTSMYKPPNERDIFTC